MSKILRINVSRSIYEVKQTGLNGCFLYIESVFVRQTLHVK